MITATINTIASVDAIDNIHSLAGGVERLDSLICCNDNLVEIRELLSPLEDHNIVSCQLND